MLAVFFLDPRTDISVGCFFPLDLRTDVSAGCFGPRPKDRRQLCLFWS